MEVVSPESAAPIEPLEFLASSNQLIYIYTIFSEYMDLILFISLHPATAKN